ncbi:molybdate ABC transporter substrate-binding protein [Rhodoblastus sphagnicola]|uniref:Molybdate ABC transporter substrate-binding protein n=1 Tax=Rhodoblastus sphagnicola TaxID=333368 RepID=A0A2S6NG72_9HYPH|nr:molybdate ABC transporter substrate-binding protein [Rhodoblastus sphagnicola]MBB4197490.1 molybdate transport system substrate-binding protein [Rhodoblastus sphagnicola]PPQ33597.1 molybdate ABC transporter substrate-binding protein [Rhodoblastus sphagnicola]
MRLSGFLPGFPRGVFLALTLAASPALALDPTPAAPAAQTSGFTIFAAASLKNALTEASAAWKVKTGEDIAISYAASFPLARQIEAGAPVDIFIGADEESMDYLAGKKLVKPESRKDFLSNDLVLIAPTGGPDKVDLTAAAVTGVLKDGRLALGDPSSVPAGKYGQAALTKLGIWDAVKDHLALADSVRSALLYVSRGETPLGVVYLTDAKAAAKETRIVATFPEASHAPIRYPIALTATAKAPAGKFLGWLLGPEGAPFFKRQGFGVLTAK